MCKYSRVGIEEHAAFKPSPYTQVLIRRRLTWNRKWKYGVGYRRCFRPEICGAVGDFVKFIFPVYLNDFLNAEGPMSNVGRNLTDVNIELHQICTECSPIVTI